MKLVLEIPDNKAAAFISHLRNLGYVRVKTEDAIPDAQQEEGLHRLQMLENGTMGVRSWAAFEKEILKRGGI